MTGECTRRDSELPLILLRKICSAECVSHLNGLLGEEGVWSGMDGIGLLCCWLCNGADDRMQTGKLKELCGEVRNQKVKFHVWHRQALAAVMFDGAVDT